MRYKITIHNPVTSFHGRRDENRKITRVNMRNLYVREKVSRIFRNLPKKVEINITQKARCPTQYLLIALKNGLASLIKVDNCKRRHVEWVDAGLMITDKQTCAKKHVINKSDPACDLFPLLNHQGHRSHIRQAL